MQLGTRLSIASIRILFCAAVIAGALGGRVSAQDAAPAPVAVQADAPEGNGLPWVLQHRAYNTWDGGTGGLYIEDPGIGQPGAVRLQLGLSTYSGGDFFYDGDDVEQNAQSFTLSVTALKVLEFYAGLVNRGTTTTIPTDPPRTSALHAFADLELGAKLGFRVGPVVRLGGGLRVLTRSDIGPEEAMLDSTSVGLRADAAFDLQGMKSPAPLIMRLNLDYLFDNSASAVEDIEDQRYESLPSPMQKSDEVAHLVSRVERYGLGINRVDLLTPAFGVEIPLELTDDFYFHPLLEYRISFPINRAGYDCPFFSGEDDRGTNDRGADDTCLDDVGVDAWPMTLALGARIVPPIRGVSFLLGFDIGLTGTSTFVRELAPTSPFKAMFAFGYDYDARPAPPPPAPVVITAPVEPEPVVGRVNGTIVDAATSAPIPGVVVALTGTDHTPLATNIAGRFTTYELQPGPVQLDLTHPDYQPGTCAGAIPEAGGDMQVPCTLTALPTTGSLTASVRDGFGGPLAGVRVVLVGPSTLSSATDADGEARFADVQPGEYQVRFESDAYLMRVTRVAVAKRQAAAFEAALVAKPAKASVTVKVPAVTARTLKFETGSTALAAGGSLALAELADYLLRNPAAGRLRIQSDGDGGLALSRALVIKQGLLDLGVTEAQLDAVGEPAPRVTLTLVP
jgi:outer membrane protein OmpA-like peptidoglycan-associated protein